MVSPAGRGLGLLFTFRLNAATFARFAFNCLVSGLSLNTNLLTKRKAVTITILAENSKNALAVLYLSPAKFPQFKRRPERFRRFSIERLTSSSIDEDWPAIVVHFKKPCLAAPSNLKVGAANCQKNGQVVFIFEG